MTRTAQRRNHNRWFGDRRLTITDGFECARECDKVSRTVTMHHTRSLTIGWFACVDSPCDAADLERPRGNQRLAHVDGGAHAWTCRVRPNGAGWTQLGRTRVATVTEPGLGREG